VTARIPLHCSPTWGPLEKSRWQERSHSPDGGRCWIAAMRRDHEEANLGQLGPTPASRDPSALRPTPVPVTRRREGRPRFPVSSRRLQLLLPRLHPGRSQFPFPRPGWFQLPVTRWRKGRPLRPVTCRRCGHATRRREGRPRLPVGAKADPGSQSPVAGFSYSCPVSIPAGPSSPFPVPAGSSSPAPSPRAPPPDPGPPEPHSPEPSPREPLFRTRAHGGRGSRLRRMEPQLLWLIGNTNNTKY